MSEVMTRDGSVGCDRPTCFEEGVRKRETVLRNHTEKEKGKHKQ